jgi:hypothetical protein
LYIQSYLQFNIRYEKVERPAPLGGALVVIHKHDVEGIVPLLESSTIAENDVLVNSVNAELGN